jgi:hypothetical protein
MLSVRTCTSLLFVSIKSFAQAKISRIHKPSLPPLPKSTICVGYSGEDALFRINRLITRNYILNPYTRAVGIVIISILYLVVDGMIYLLSMYF